MKQSSYAIGIDVGGTSLKCGLVNQDGGISYSFLFPLLNVTTEGEVIALINAAIRKCAEQAQGKVIGVGIGFPGIVENNTVIGGADNLPGFDNLELGKIIAASTSLNVVIDNDANMMGWGEFSYGAAKHCTDVVFITIGTGIGGSLVINGALYGGYRNHGTELGHIIIQQGGLACSCGASGCFEAYASVSALINDYAIVKGINPDGINGRTVVSAYHAGEREAVAALNRHFDHLATGVASLVNVFSPQKVVLGGGITESGAFYVQEVRTRVHGLAMPAASKYTTVTGALLGNQAGLLGCGGRVFSMFSTK